MKSQPTRCHLITSVAALVCAVGCHVNFNFIDGYRFDYEGETAERTVGEPIGDSVQFVEVDHRFGDVIVETTDEAPSWKWELKCWATEQSVAEAYLDIIYLQVHAIEENQSWKLVLPEDAEGLRGVRSKLTLSVPPSVEVNIANRHGACNVSGVQGAVEVNNGHGAVRLADLSAPCEINNAHGNLSAERIASAKLANQHGDVEVDGAAQIEVTAAHGRVRLNDIAGRAVVDNRHGNIEVDDLHAGGRLQTAHASIRVENAAGELDLENEHGSIAVTNADGKISAKTSHGQIVLDVSSPVVECEGRHSKIELTLAREVPKSVVAATTHGRIELTLPADAIVDVDAHADHGNVENEFTNVIDGAQIKLRTTYGSIDVRKAD